MTHPYTGLPDERFWSRSVAWSAPGHVDPVLRGEHIAPHHRVATLGSCFAQHLSRHIQASGLHYFVAEPAPEDMDAAAAAQRQFGVFSARYGNVYTVRQALQLYDRAFGHFQPRETVWQRGARFVDPFRPQVEPDGFDSPEAVTAAAQAHLACVREVFTRADWLVFTLGLTEAWRSRADGAVYPLAPGVAGGEYALTQHEFVNFTAAEVSADLSALVDRIGRVNPAVRVLLTVSPVPLIATREDRHVLLSNSYSKAALRVAADEVERRHGNVRYFPSYEIITSPAAGGRYYADDLRQVTDLGVRHVMRLFSRHFIGGEPQAPEAVPAMPAGPLARTDSAPLCDEEAIETALRLSGMR